MIESGILISSFYLKKRYDKTGEKQALLPYEILENKSDFSVTDYLLNFLYKSTNPIDDESLSKLFSIEKRSIKVEENSEFYYITCVIKSGSYGLESDITDRKTQDVVYSRKKDDADIKRFRCLFYIPKNKNNFLAKKGIIVFQTLGNYGVKTITLKHIKKFFSKNGFTFESRTISATDFLRNLIENNRLKKITFIKNVISEDDCDNLYVQCGREERSYVRPRLKDRIYHKLMNLVEKKFDKSNYAIEFGDECFEDIKLTFKIGNSQKTASITRIDKFSIVETIPQKIFKESTRNPDILVRYILNAINPYLKNMILYEEIGN